MCCQKRLLTADRQTGRAWLELALEIYPNTSACLVSTDRKKKKQLTGQLKISGISILLQHNNLNQQHYHLSTYCFVSHFGFFFTVENFLLTVIWQLKEGDANMVTKHMFLKGNKQI